MPSSTTADQTVELEAIPEAERRSRLLALFDALPPGERLVVSGAREPAWLLSALQAERKGLFEWSPLETRSGRSRVEVARRAGHLGDPRGVDEALSWDHDRLDALELAAFERRAARDLAGACRLYAEFAVGLRRHIGFEEQLVFPAFERAAGMPPTVGPTAVMRAEHREIESLLGQIEAGMGDAGAPVEELRRRFHAVLGDHNEKEERVLYPTTDDLLGKGEADRLVSQVQGLGVPEAPGAGRP
jgi:uncharacterized protein (DUF2249 family)/hemerythrin-like domain-containing protein